MMHHKCIASLVTTPAAVCVSLSHVMSHTLRAQQGLTGCHAICHMYTTCAWHDMVHASPLVTPGHNCSNTASILAIQVASCSILHPLCIPQGLPQPRGSLHLPSLPGPFPRILAMPQMHQPCLLQAGNHRTGFRHPGPGHDKPVAAASQPGCNNPLGFGAHVHAWLLPAMPHMPQPCPKHPGNQQCNLTHSG